MITLHFKDMIDMAEWLPDAPDYVAGDGAWMSREQAAVVCQMSESGFDALRRRMKRIYEHKDKAGRVWLYFPLWSRVYFTWLACHERQKATSR